MVHRTKSLSLPYLQGLTYKHRALLQLLHPPAVMFRCLTPALFVTTAFINVKEPPPLILRHIVCLKMHVFAATFLKRRSKRGRNLHISQILWGGNFLLYHRDHIHPLGTKGIDDPFPQRNIIAAFWDNILNQIKNHHSMILRCLSLPIYGSYLLIDRHWTCYAKQLVWPDQGIPSSLLNFHNSNDELRIPLLL